MLFPDETAGTASTRVADRTDRLTIDLERAGPNWRRFVNGLDSDDDSDEYEEPFPDGPTKEGRHGKKATSTSERTGVRRKGPGSEPKDSSDVVNDCTCKQCASDHPELCEEWEDEIDSENDNQYIYHTADGDPETFRIALAFEKLEPVNGYGDDPETGFWEFLDRENAKIFKQWWYAAIVDERERERYDVLNAWIKRLSATRPAKPDVQFCCRTLIWLRVHTSSHRIVWKDIVSAFQSMAIFFDGAGDCHPSDLPLRNEIADNNGRAANRPYSRTFQSNLLLPARFWREADELNERRQDACRRRIPFYDREGDKNMRLIIAHWFKAGVICAAHIPYPTGDCVVSNEEGKSRPDLFIDYRSMREDWPAIRGDFKAITDPYKVDLLRSARAFSEGRPHARFALLRVWSHSHFYPLMLGWESRDNSSFQDEVSRTWSWKFVPRDLPGSEWSMQKGVDLRLDPFRKQLGKQVIAKRDMVLVVAKNEEELKRFALGV